MADYWNDPWLWAGMGLTMMVIAVAHWITKNGVEAGDEIAEQDELLGNYAVGVAAILAGLLLWFGMNGWWVRWIQIFLFAFAAGITVWLAYQHDLRAHYRALRKAERERERERGRRGEVE